MCKNNLGFISAKYESGNLGCSAISSTPNDPGGASYGTYQLSSKAGTLQSFLKVSKYWTSFIGLYAGTSAFNAHWIVMAADPAFCQAQHDFIQATHFTPVINYWTSQYQLLRSCAIDEAIWSLSVQHGFSGCCIIIDNMQDALPDNYTQMDIISNLYKCREAYIDGLALSPAIKLSLHNRYKAEMADINNIQD